MRANLRQYGLIWLPAAALCLAIPGCYRTTAVPVGPEGAEFSKPTLQAKLAPQSVPEDNNVPAGMTSDARHFMLAANDSVRVDIQRFDFTITDHRNPGAPPAQCTPYASQNNRGGGPWACDGAFRNKQLGNVLYKIRVYQCANGMACPEDPQANAPNLVLESDAMQMTGNPPTAVPAQPVFQVKEDAIYQIKAVLIITQDIGSTVPGIVIEGPPLDAATLSVVTPGMTRTFPSPAGTTLAGRDFAPLGPDSLGSNPFTFTELPTLGDHYVNFSKNLAVTSVQVLDETGTPIQFCAVRIATADRCATTAPDLTTVDLSNVANCPELARHETVGLTPAHESMATDLTPVEWIVLFSTPRGLPDINCHPSVPAPTTKLSLSFQLKVK